MEKQKYSQYPTRLLPVRNRIETLLALGQVMTFQKGEIVAEAGVIPQYCYLVKSGCIITLEYTAFGEERLYNIMEAGTIMLEPNLLCKFPPSVNFIAEEDSVLIQIDRGALMQAMESDPGLNFDIIESMSMKFFAAMEQIIESNNHTVPWKVCNLLLILADRYGVPSDVYTRINKKITQKTMAGMIGINRITLTRIMKKLFEDGIVDRCDGYYLICPLDQMKAYQEKIDEMAYKKMER